MGIFGGKESEAQRTQKEQLSAGAKAYSEKTIGSVGKLPLVSRTETTQVDEYFLGGSPVGQIVKPDEYWQHVERSLSALSGTNPDLAEFIQRNGSDIGGRDGRDVIMFVVGMLANNQPTDK